MGTIHGYDHGHDWKSDRYDFDKYDFEFFMSTINRAHDFEIHGHDMGTIWSCSW